MDDVYVYRVVVKMPSLVNLIANLAISANYTIIAYLQFCIKLRARHTFGLNDNDLMR